MVKEHIKFPKKQQQTCASAATKATSTFQKVGRGEGVPALGPVLAFKIYLPIIHSFTYLLIH